MPKYKKTTGKTSKSKRKTSKSKSKISKKTTRKSASSKKHTPNQEYIIIDVVPSCPATPVKITPPHIIANSVPNTPEILSLYNRQKTYS